MLRLVFRSCWALASQRREELDRGDAQRGGRQVAQQVAAGHLAEGIAMSRTWDDPPAIRLASTRLGERSEGRSGRTDLVDQDELVGIQQGPEQVLQDLEAVGERCEVLAGLVQLLGGRVAGSGPPGRVESTM